MALPLVDVVPGKAHNVFRLVTHPPVSNMGRHEANQQLRGFAAAYKEIMTRSHTPADTVGGDVENTPGRPAIFHQFTMLPPEVQDQIWDMSFVPYDFRFRFRVEILELEEEVTAWTPMSCAHRDRLATIPQLITCKASRERALKLYGPCPMASHMPFSPAFDRIGFELEPSTNEAVDFPTQHGPRKTLPLRGWKRHMDQNAFPAGPLSVYLHLTDDCRTWHFLITEMAINIFLDLLWEADKVEGLELDATVILTRGRTSACVNRCFNLGFASRVLARPFRRRFLQCIPPETRAMLADIVRELQPDEGDTFIDDTPFLPSLLVVLYHMREHEKLRSVTLRVEA